MNDMRAVLNHINEDFFKGPSEDDITVKKDAAKVAKTAQLAARKKELGREVDICPHCNADLRETGVYQDESSWATVNRYWNVAQGYWDYGDTSAQDSEVGGAYCSNCGGVLKQGENWNANED